MFNQIAVYLPLLLGTIETLVLSGSIGQECGARETIVVQGDESPDVLAARQQAWQKILERREFRFPEANAGVVFSMSQYSGDCQIHMIHDRAKPKLRFKFVRGGKDILEIEGHTGSTFRTLDNVLFFAHFSRSSHGCTVAAYDLDDGKKLWDTKLKAVGSVQHSGYTNQVSMGLSSLQRFDKKGEGVVSIIGAESYGDYIEVLDRKTGALLAHKIYRKGYVIPKTRPRKR